MAHSYIIHHDFQKQSGPSRPSRLARHRQPSPHLPPCNVPHLHGFCIAIYSGSGGENPVSLRPDSPLRIPCSIRSPPTGPRGHRETPLFTITITITFRSRSFDFPPSSMRRLRLLVSDFVVDAFFPQVLRSSCQILPSCKSVGFVSVHCFAGGHSWLREQESYFLHNVPGRLLPRLFAVTGLLALGLF